MFLKRSVRVMLLLVMFVLLLSIVTIASAQDPPTPPVPVDEAKAVELGRVLFFDESLSSKNNQSCAACHSPETGFTGPHSDINAAGAAYPGSLPHRIGNRKPPTAAYGGDSPILHPEDETYVGGMFWDGRASGWTLGDPLAEQAKGPFLNPLEQALANEQVLCRRVAKSDYAALFEEVWGPGSLDCAKDTQGVYDKIGVSIAYYERSPEVNPFNSRYDEYLASGTGLTEQELSGLALFEGQAQCSACHPSDGDRPLFTDFTYDNLGVPRNPENPFYGMPAAYNPDGENWVDPGLGGFLGDDDFYGAQKVPTLRNVDKRPSEDFVKAYTHNGYFKSLYDIVHFYNTRDLDTQEEWDAWLALNAEQGCAPEGVNLTDFVVFWPEPEVAENINEDELGDLGLTYCQEQDIVAFMTTLSDQ